MAALPDVRIKKRVPCLVALSGGCQQGMVLNISRSGLFVQLSAVVDPGQEVRLELRLTGRARPIPLAGGVVYATSS